MSNAKTNLPNPKDFLGAKKVPFTCFPAAGQIHGSMAMEDGEFKYGFMNWREHPVKARIYIDAMKRHIAAWEDGEETAQDSLVHHLGHVIACAAILLDAQEVGNLLDDRSKSGKTADLLNRMSEVLKKKQAERKAKKEEAEGIAKFQRNTADLKDAAENSETPLEFLQRLADKVLDVRTIPVQGSPKDSAEVPVRLDMGSPLGGRIMPKEEALASLKKDSDRFADDIRTSRFGIFAERTNASKVPNGF